MRTGKTSCMAHVASHHKTVHVAEPSTFPGKIVLFCNGRTTTGMLEPEGTQPTCQLCIKRMQKETK